MARSRALFSRLLALSAVLLVLAVARAGDGEKMPQPRKEWWKALKGGEVYVFEGKTGTKSVREKIVVERVAGSTLTLRIEKVAGGLEAPVERKTLDAAELRQPKSTGGAVKLGTETLEVGGRELPCQVWELSDFGFRTRWWYCDRIPFCFKDSIVKLEVLGSKGKHTSQGEMVSYDGALVGD